MWQPESTMPSRRNVLLGLANLAGSGAVIGAQAFGGTTTDPDADLRVLPDGRRGDLILKPCRDNPNHVITNPDGEVTEIVLTGNGAGLNTHAKTVFECVAEIHRKPTGQPIDELYLEFIVEDQGLGPDDPTPSEIAEVLSIVTVDAEIPGTGDTNYLTATDQQPVHNDLLYPNQFVPFGIAVDLYSHGISDLPDPSSFGLTIKLTARHVG